MNLCSSEVAEDTDVSPFPHPRRHGFCQPDTASHHDDINVLRRPFEEEVADVAPDDIGFDPHFVGHVSDEMEDACIQ